MYVSEQKNNKNTKIISISIHPAIYDESTAPVRAFPFRLAGWLDCPNVFIPSQPPI